jgi:hypothetical protein
LGAELGLPSGAPSRSRERYSMAVRTCYPGVHDAPVRRATAHKPC